MQRDLMQWIQEKIQKSPLKALTVPVILGAVSFLGNLLIAAGDGNIDGTEIHNLLSSASGIETIIVMLVMLALKNK